MRALYFIVFYAINECLAFTENLSSTIVSSSNRARSQGDPTPAPFQPDQIILSVAGNVTAQVILHSWEGCEVRDPCDVDYTKQQIVKYGFEEMQRMIPDNWDNPPDPNGFPEHRYTIDWNSAAAIEFWSSKRKTDSYRHLVQENLDSLAGQQSSSWFDWKLHVRCDDPIRECGTITEAYTVNGGE